MTRCASASSSLASSSAAGAEVVTTAAARLGAPARFGLLFVGSAHTFSEVLAAARAAAPGVDLMACTTAGEITEAGLTHGAVSAMLVAGDDLAHDLSFTGGLRADFTAAASALTARFAETGAAARRRGWIDSTTITLVDGLAGTGEKLVSAIVRGTRAAHQVVGGAAGDEGKFASTWVGANGASGTDHAAALHLFGPRPIGVGVQHGLRPATDKMVVTRAAANVVYAIDGRPAFDVYRDFARDKGVELTRDNAGAFLINNELGVYFLRNLQRARAPLSVGGDGSLTCAAEIEEGESVCILGGDPDDLVAAAAVAAQEARDRLRGAPAAGVLLFDCICRGAILGDAFKREIDAVRRVFPDVPVAGFLTYGEIARYAGKLDGWHNTTAVVVALPA